MQEGELRAALVAAAATAERALARLQRAEECIRAASEHAMYDTSTSRKRLQEIIQNYHSDGPS